MNTRVAFYARVSSEQQSQAGTIESQIGALKARITEDKHIVLKEFEFIDDGYSGSTLSRPELERLEMQHTIIYWINYMYTLQIVWRASMLINIF